jgi:4-hydroxy-4-methyl-2-oxoglutarate aldolase
VTRTHSTATLYEAALAEQRRRSPDDNRVDRKFAVDPAIRAAWPGACLAGPAYTVQGAGGDNLALHHAVQRAPTGSVLVADLCGATFGHWGEVLAVAAQQRGIAGLLIDGGVRDVEDLRRLAFPAFSRNNTVLGTRKFIPGVLDVEIEVGGVRVRSGDFVVGDADGAVVLPSEHAGAIIATADERVSDEESIIRALRAGRNTLDLYGLPRLPAE